MLLEQLALPLGHRLGGRLAGLAALAGDQALGDRVRDHAGQQVHGADGVVVARDRVGDLVRIAVGVQDGDDRDAELLGLVDGQVLLLGVHDPHGGGGLGHVADAAEVGLQLLELTVEQQQLLLGELRAGHVLEVDLLELLHALHALGDGGEVGQHAAEPAVVHVGHAHAAGLLRDGLLGLLLGADEQDGAAVGDGLLDELVGAVDVGQRLLEVDDVDAVALGEDEALHLGVPAAGLVAEVDTGVEELAHGHDGHDVPFCGSRGTPRFTRGRSAGRFLDGWRPARSGGPWHHDGGLPGPTSTRADALSRRTAGTGPSVGAGPLKRPTAMRGVGVRGTAQGRPQDTAEVNPTPGGRPLPSPTPAQGPVRRALSTMGLRARHAAARDARLTP